MNRITIKLFATLRERAGASELSREFPDGATVAEIDRLGCVAAPSVYYPVAD